MTKKSKRREIKINIKPGISIVRSADPPNVCTLGVFFQEEGSGNVFLQNF